MFIHKNIHGVIRRAQGFGLLEIVVAIAVISVTLFALLSAAQISSRAIRESVFDTQASFLAEEGIDAVRLIRDSSWNNISELIIDQTYYLVFSNGAWHATTAPQVIDGIFSRYFILGDVFRDANDSIAPSGTLDSGSRKVTLVVTWAEGTKKREVVTYVMNLFQE